MVPLERNLYGHPLAGLLWERQFEDVLSELGWEKSGMSVFSKKTMIILIGIRGRLKIAGTKQNMAPMWKKLMTNVDLHDPTSILDLVYLGCTRRECKANETVIEEFTRTAEATENYQDGKRFTQKQ